MNNLCEKYKDLDMALTLRKRKLMDEILPFLVSFKEDTGFSVDKISIGWGEVPTGPSSSEGVRRYYQDSYRISVK